MQKLGFNQGWINLVLMCITSATFSFNINGDPKGFFHSFRGVRQGDPLSPYLFIICAEGLSNKLKMKERLNDIKGIAACRTGPSISHLFFADNSLLFTRATEKDGRSIMKILKEYEQASGQLVNIQKSSIFFSPNSSSDLKESIHEIIGVEGHPPHEKYLGLPSLIGRSRNQIFAISLIVFVRR